MKYELGQDRREFRATVRQFFTDHVTKDMVSRAHQTGSYHDPDLYRAVAERGWIGLLWPKEEGGQGHDALDALVFGQEAQRVQAPLMMLGITLMVANTIRVAATLQQRADILPQVLSGNYTFCLGYTEPGAGSDVAAAGTRAIRDGDEWVINGQKIFTTLAHASTHVFLLCRTDASAPKYRNLTLFLVPLDRPGISIDPISTLSGERTNTTFYSDVRVGDDLRIGAVNGGWGVMREALVQERGGSLGDVPDILQYANHILPRAVCQSRETGSLTAQQRMSLARLAIHAEVSRLLDLRVRSMIVDGASPGVEGSIQKLYSSEHLVEDALAIMDAFGPNSVIEGDDPGAVLAGMPEYYFRHSVVTTIYGGTSEVQRSVIAERGLGLPRTR